MGLIRPFLICVFKKIFKETFLLSGDFLTAPSRRFSR